MLSDKAMLPDKAMPSNKSKYGAELTRRTRRITLRTCIGKGKGKGKARIRWEFGVKVSLAVTNARAPGGEFVLGARACPGNPYDGHTLRAQLDQVERLTGQPVARAYVDLGYHGHDAADGHTEVYISRQRNLPSPTIKRELSKQRLQSVPLNRC